MITQKDKEKLIHLILAVVPNAKIYLFGSQAQGVAKDSSDIDIALEANEPISRFDIAEIKTIIEGSRISKQVDVVDINSVDEKFKNEILRTRILWKS